MTDGPIDPLAAALSGRYRIERKLGEGGMATVYLAHDLRHERPVALKVLRPNLAAVMGADRFLAEIRTTANLQHPHILPLFDSGAADGFLYYVMPYVEGETLREWFEREGQIGVEDAVRIVCAVAGALQAAHDAGVIHRDIKPENILISRGEPLVSDFGIALAVGEAGGDRLTHTGLVVGTPAYMSPEQATGGTVDHRSDIYSLACILYEALIGDVPHGGPTPHVIMARRASEPPPGVRVVRETVPAHVEEALMGALARVPADRISNAGDFARALAGEINYTRPRVQVKGPRTTGRTFALAGLAALAAAVASYFWLPGSDPSPTPPQITFSQITARPGVEDFPSISPDGEWVVYAGEGPTSRDVYLQSVAGRREINLTEGSSDDDYAPAFSPDGERIAFRSSRDGGGLFVMGRTGEAVRRVNRAGFNPAWSPSGTHLTYATEHVELLPLNWDGRSELWVVQVESGEETLIHEGDGVQPTWSPDGRWIAFTARMSGQTQMDIWLVPASGGEPIPLTSDVPTDWSPRWSPEGDYVYFSSDRRGSMNLWRVPVDQQEGRATGPPEAITTPAAFAAHPSVSDDGSRVVFSSSQMTANVYSAVFDPETGSVGEPEPVTTGSRQWSSPDPSPDGERVVFYSRDLPEGDLYVSRIDGSGLRQVTADSALDRMPRWSPAGDRIAYFSNRSGLLQTWTISPDGSGGAQITFDDPTSFGAWSPDGARFAVGRVASGEAASNVMVVEPGSNAGFSTLTEPESASFMDFTANDWSQDGRLLAGMEGVADTGVILYDLVSETFERLTDFGQWPVFLPDSRRILFVTGGDRFLLLDPETGALREVYQERRNTVGPPRMTRDGRTIVFTRRVAEADVWVAEIG